MTINKELLKGSTVTLVLTVLSKKKMYGYEIIKELKEQSQNLFQLKEGTLYPILHSLEEAGCVEAEWVGAEGTRKRKYYIITRSGRALLKDKKEEWSNFKSAVDMVVFSL